MKRILFAWATTMLVLGSARAEEPVHFVDARLKEVVEDKLWISDPTPTDMLGLVELVCQNLHGPEGAISDLTGVEYATNLCALNLRNHRISNVSALSGLTGLRTVALLGNRITSISPLAGLSQLETVRIKGVRYRFHRHLKSPTGLRHCLSIPAGRLCAVQSQRGL